jgi:pSer/pThr/pTyr-binding forkhead associated (FHA) protein
MSGILILILRLLLVVCLYAFLAWALYTLWKDMRTQAGAISAPRIPALILACPDQDPLEERSFQVPEVIIGRSASNEYPIANETVSSRHARLSYHHNQWWLEDLNSTNGTFLNDEHVSVATVVVSGDELRVGQVIMQISILEKG